MPYFVYILASKKNGTLYTGVTSDLLERIYQHKSGTVEGFYKKHDVRLLVYFEIFDQIIGAIEREKHIKKWRRSKKIRIIEDLNPEWKDLYFSFVN